MYYPNRHRKHIQFQLTPPMWVATHDDDMIKAAGKISTHATHVGGDISHISDTPTQNKFQLTPPMWVATANGIRTEHHISVFQLTPPMWVATADIRKGTLLTEFQLTPPMWVAT